MPLSDRIRTAFVTGAGSGLGAAFGSMLLAEGVQVWGTSRHPEKLALASGFHPVALELAETRSIDEAWMTAEKQSGGIDLLVNNAGGAVFGPLGDVSASAWEEQLAVLLHGPVRLARHAATAMRQRRCGLIVNVTSLAVEFPVPYLSAYNAAKSGLAGFTAALDVEAAPDGIVVIDFRPGDFATNFNRAMEVRGGAVTNDVRAARVWSRLETLMRAAPPPAQAGGDLRRALARGRSGVVRSGGFFQVRIAPWGNLLLPVRIMRLFHSFYFRTRN